MPFHGFSTSLPGEQGERNELAHTSFQRIDDFHPDDDGVGVNSFIYAAFLWREVAGALSGMVTQVLLERKSWMGVSKT